MYPDKVLVMTLESRSLDQSDHGRLDARLEVGVREHDAGSGLE